ncbi:unnamed protein product, partial [marine sediment metagenome]
MGKFERFDSFRQEFFTLPVFDTHTHMNMPGIPVAAQSVWDVMHYFWFHRELIAAGYPARPMELNEQARYAELENAFALTRNTSWNWAVRKTARQLYDID